MRHLLLLLSLAAPAAASDCWPSLGGCGLLTLPDTATLARGRLAAGIGADNKDRDPLGLDVFDYALTAHLGLSKRADLEVRGVFSRVVAMPQTPALPPAPLELVVPPGTHPPPAPWHLVYWPTPFVNKRGTARFDDFVRGDLGLSLKARVRESDGWKPALALGAQLTLPLARDTQSLISGSGTGGVDLTGRLVAEWRRGRASVVAHAAYTRVGAAARGDRTLAASDAGVSVTDVSLDPPDRVDVGLGFRRELSPSLAAAAEVVGTLDAGSHTPVLDPAQPLDWIGGVQWRHGRLRLTAALRWHADSPQSGVLHSLPLAGLLDVTDVDPARLEAYLRAVGAGAALAQLRSGTQRVVVPPPLAPPPPEGARVIPPEYTVHAEHNLGFVLALRWAF